MRIESNPRPVQLKPLVAATLRQARHFTRRYSSTSPASAISPASTNTPSLFLILLPADVRARIYHFVFAGREIQIYMAGDYIKGLQNPLMLRHSDIDSSYVGGKCTAGWRGEVVRQYPEDDQYLVFRQEPKVTRNLLGLALCCQQVYAESIKFLYASTGFTIFEPFTLCQFVNANEKRADYMRWVRVMRLEYGFEGPASAREFNEPYEPGVWDRSNVCWYETCRSLGLMTGLKLLHVTLCSSEALAKRHCANDMMWEMLELLRMAKADECRVSVRKQFMKFREMLGDAPFELCEIYEDY